MKKIIIGTIIILSLVGCDIINEARGFENDNTDNQYQSSYENNNDKDIDDNNDVLNFNIEYDEWLKATKEDDYVITLIGASYCSHCIGFRPILENVCKKYNIPLYFYYVNELVEEEYALITGTYETNYEGKVPHMFITKNGKVITNKTSSMNEEELIEFLKLNMIIE